MAGEDMAGQVRGMRVLIAIAVMVSVAIIACASPSKTESSPKTERSSAGGFNCMVTGDGDVEHCSRIAEDLHGRAVLTDSQRAHAKALADEAQFVVSTFGRCAPTAATCQRNTIGRPPTAGDVAGLAANLADKGLTATIRVASGEDPAPKGALLYAVDLDPAACLVGYLTAVPDEGSGFVVAGRMADGHCLGAR